jgi:hypothetical protein
MAANRLWAGLLLEQVGDPAMHSQLGFELADRFSSRHQLRLLHGRQPRLETPVDAVLTSPRVDRLIADPEIRSNLGDLAAGLHQIQYAPAKLRRIPTSPHAVLLQDSSIRVQLHDSTKPGAHQAPVGESWCPARTPTSATSSDSRQRMTAPTLRTASALPGCRHASAAEGCDSSTPASAAA